MMVHSEISFIRKSHEDGFGFACMKAAYFFGITGRMDYGLSSSITILAEGENEKICDFIKWIELNLNNSTKIIYDNSLINNTKYKEFDIFRNSG